VNKDYLASHENRTVRIEVDEMRSFYQDKKHQIRLRGLLTAKPVKPLFFGLGRGRMGIFINCWNCLSRLT
jgi:hypothetical protein